MSDKACLKCKLTKPVTIEFWPVYSRAKGVTRYRNICKVCQNENGRNFYSKSHSTQKATRKRSKAQRQRTSKMLITIKEAQGCCDCKREGKSGEWPGCVLDFDHRPGVKKLFTIGEKANAVSKNALTAEIAKCDVVCANHHRERTHNRSLQ